jgi:hypothetical protein
MSNACRLLALKFGKAGILVDGLFPLLEFPIIAFGDNVAGCGGFITGTCPNILIPLINKIMKISMKVFIFILFVLK